MTLSRADVDTAIGVVTGVIAVLVFLEARRIQDTEWLTRSVQLWQGFNQILLTDDRAARWRSFLRGEVTEADFGPDDHYVLYSYLNIIYTEYRYAKRGLLDRGYAMQSLQDNLRQVAKAGPYVIPVLRDTGYDNELVDIIEAVSEGRELRIPGRFQTLRFAIGRRRDRKDSGVSTSSYR